jgi:hypothetical protein
LSVAFYREDLARKPYDWHATSIRVILKNPVYLGKTVFGKTATNGFYSKKRPPTGEEDWIMVEGTHESIIDPLTWDDAFLLPFPAKAGIL